MITMPPSLTPVMIITGAAKRIGSFLAAYFHSLNFNILIHYNTSTDEALELKNTLNRLRADSAHCIQFNLATESSYEKIIQEAVLKWGRIDVFINNASLYYPLPFAETSFEDWERVFALNLKSCFFLCQMAYPHLQKTGGCIINISDAKLTPPRPLYTLYTMTKIALESMTQSLALDFTLDVRINAIALGKILPPCINGVCDNHKHIPALEQKKSLETIATTLKYLIDTKDITGRIIQVDKVRNQSE